MLLSTGAKTSPYEKLRLLDATGLLKRAQDETELRPLLDGLDDHLRTAHAHRSVTYFDDKVVTDLRSGGREISVDDLVDQTFAAMESLLASLMGLRVALAANDFALDESSRFEALGMTTAEVVAFMVESIARVTSEVECVGGIIRVRLPTSSPIGLSGSIGAAVASMPSDSDWLIRIEPDGSAALNCPISAYKDFANAQDELGKSIALVRIQRSWRDDADSPHLPDDSVRRWVAAQVSELLELDVPTRVRALRRIKEFADQEGLADVVAAVNDMIRLARLQAMDVAPDANERGVLNLLSVWVALESPMELI